MCYLPTWLVSSEPTNPGPIRNHSRDIQEGTLRKPGTNWGRLPEWSSSWNECFSQLNNTRFRPERCLRHMKWAQKEILHCSRGISGKQKKARSSQPYFRKENTPETIAADQLLLAFSRTVIKIHNWSLCMTTWICAISWS